MRLQQYLFALFAVGWFFTQQLAHANDAAPHNRISLQASVQREIDHDLMRVTLYSEDQDTDSARLAQETTKRLNQAIIKARKIEGVAIQSGSRSTSPIYGQRSREADWETQKIVGWQERATLHLESNDFEALAALTADLTTDLKMDRINFLVSKTRKEAVEAELLEEAITAFGERARLITRRLGGKSYKIITFATDDGNNHYRPMRSENTGILQSLSSDAIHVRMMDEGMSQQVEAGTSEVAVTISGVIECKCSEVPVL